VTEIIFSPTKRLTQCLMGTWLFVGLMLYYQENLRGVVAVVVGVIQREKVK